MWEAVKGSIMPIGVLVPTTLGNSMDPFTLQPTVDLNVTVTEGIVASYTTREYQTYKESLRLSANSRRVLIRNPTGISFTLEDKLLTWKSAKLKQGPLLLLHSWEDLINLTPYSVGVAAATLTDGTLTVPQGCLIKSDPSVDGKYLMYPADGGYVIKQIRQYVPGSTLTVVLDCDQVEGIWTMGL